MIEAATVDLKLDGSSSYKKVNVPLVDPLLLHGHDGLLDHAGSNLLHLLVGAAGDALAADAAVQGAVKKKLITIAGFLFSFKRPSSFS